MENQIKNTQIKYCRKCQVQLIVGDNWLESQIKSRSYICNGCRKEKNKEYDQNNKDKKKEYLKEYYENNKQKLKEKNKEYYENNKDTIKEYNKKYHKEYYEENIVKIRDRHKEYSSRPEAKKKLNARLKIRRQTDPWYDARCKLRKATNRLIKNCLMGYGKNFSGVGDLGCGKEVFIAHIESQFQPGMTWENRGKYGWHYDHIISICEIDPTDREAVKRLLHYTNLRPLWAVDNLKKSAEDKKKSINYKGNK